MFLLPKKTIKALLSISDGRAASFFNTFIKIITPPPFYGQRIFGCKDTKKKRDTERKTEKFREKRRKIEKKWRHILAILQMLSDVSRSFFVSLLMRKPGA